MVFEIWTDDSSGYENLSGKRQSPLSSLILNLGNLSDFKASVLDLEGSIFVVYTRDSKCLYSYEISHVIALQQYTFHKIKHFKYT